MIKTYIKKPVKVKAVLWDNSDEALRSILELSDRNISLNEGGLYISTLEGEMHASLGDYIVQGIEGEVYPCKPDIFKKSYELVKE